MAGVDMLRCDVHHCAVRRRDAERDRDVRAAHPDLEWIVGGGWSMEHFPGGTPTRAMLDAVVPDRPAYLPNRDGHGAWVNTPRAGAGRDRRRRRPTPPTAGSSARPTATPRGRCTRAPCSLVEPAAAGTCDRTSSWPACCSPRTTCSRWGSPAGRTLPSARCSGRRTSCRPTCAAARSGQLRARVVGALWWDRERGAEQIPELVERRGRGRATAGSGRPRSRSCRTASPRTSRPRMLEPYLDGCGCRTDNSGLSFVDPVGLREYVTRLDAAGFQVHFHALGDRAVREALDALEAARAANGADRRPSPPGAPAGRPSRRHARVRPARRRSRTCRRCGPPTSRRWTS